MYKQLIEKNLKEAVLDLGFLVTDTLLSIAESPQFGDYSTNIALQLSKQKLSKGYQSSLEIANKIVEKIGHPNYLERIEVAGPGFINFFLKNESLIKILEEKIQPKTGGRRVLIEYAQPNTHKEFHLGHLRNITLGESLARLREFEGDEVFRANYGSDIGLPVAKALWGVDKLRDQLEGVRQASLREKAEFLGRAYALGHTHYEDDEKAKEQIDAINKALYVRDPQFMPLWQETRQWSLAYFDTIYSRLGTEFDAVITESEVEAEGKRLVEENLHKVFAEDQGAVIFPGEKYGLHNRVFITSRGNPTYEAKELGLTRREEEFFPFDQAIHLTGNEQIGYFKVVIKAVELINPQMAGKKKHMPFGFVTLTTGKMSSRLGTVVTAEWLIEEVKQAIRESFGQQGGKVSFNETTEKIAIGAIKFSLLKYSLATNIAFDIHKSVSLQGDSGPYVMYAYARIRSLIEKAGVSRPTSLSGEIELEEREVLRLLEYFEAVAEKAVLNFAPNELCIYLLGLAKAFNLFYEKHPIIGSQRASLRLKLAARVGDTLKLGLYLLGIESVDKM